MKNYDGWMIKSFYTKTPFLMVWTFQETRKEAFGVYEDSVGCDWKEERRRGKLKMVKVKMVEVT